MSVFISLLSVNLLLSYCSVLYMYHYAVIIFYFIFLFYVYLSKFFILCCCNIIVTGVRFYLYMLSIRYISVVICYCFYSLVIYMLFTVAHGLVLSSIFSVIIFWVSTAYQSINHFYYHDLYSIGYLYHIGICIISFLLVSLVSVFQFFILVYRFFHIFYRFLLCSCIHLLFLRSVGIMVNIAVFIIVLMVSSHVFYHLVSHRFFDLSYLFAVFFLLGSIFLRFFLFIYFFIFMALFISLGISVISFIILYTRCFFHIAHFLLGVFIYFFIYYRSIFFHLRSCFFTCLFSFTKHFILIYIRYLFLFGCYYF